MVDSHACTDSIKGCFIVSSLCQIGIVMMLLDSVFRLKPPTVFSHNIFAQHPRAVSSSVSGWKNVLFGSVQLVVLGRVSSQFSCLAKLTVEWTPCSLAQRKHRKTWQDTPKLRSWYGNHTLLEIDSHQPQPSCFGGSPSRRAPATKLWLAAALDFHPLGIASSDSLNSRNQATTMMIILSHDDTSWNTMN